MTEKPEGTYRESDSSAVAMPDAKTEWAATARTVLEGIAGSYHGLINYGELAEAVQAGSGVRTRSLMRNWIGDVLDLVGQECQERGEPLLSALCVRTDGTIGDGYGLDPGTSNGDEPPDLDMIAAEERLKCYVHFGAKIPADGGRPALTPQVASRRRTAARRARDDYQRPVCPTCHLALPATGRCDNCAE